MLFPFPGAGETGLCFRRESAHGIWTVHQTYHMNPIFAIQSIALPVAEVFAAVEKCRRAGRGGAIAESGVPKEFDITAVIKKGGTRIIRHVDQALLPNE